jgi:hypothetical protein
MVQEEFKAFKIKQKHEVVFHVHVPSTSAISIAQLLDSLNASEVSKRRQPDTMSL